MDEQTKTVLRSGLDNRGVEAGVGLPFCYTKASFAF